MDINEIEEKHDADCAWTGHGLPDFLIREAALIAMVRQLEADKAGLVKSLKYYADKTIYEYEFEDQNPPIYYDSGEAARIALAKHGGKVEIQPDIHTL